MQQQSLSWTALGLSTASIVISITGWFVVNRLAVERERRRDGENRKREFAAAVRALRYDCARAQGHELVGVHAGSVQWLPESSAKVQKDVAGAKHASFKAAVDAYLGLCKEDIECRDHSQLPPAPKDQFGNYAPGVTLTWQPPARYEYGRKKLLALLDTLIESTA